MKKNMVWLLLTSFSLFIIAGCGDGKSSTASSDNQSKYAGQYVSSSWNNDSVAHFLVKPTGELSGYLLVSNGWGYEMTGTVQPTGAVTIAIADSTTHQPLPGTTSTGTCDGAGTITGTTSSPNGPFQYVLKRVDADASKYYGIYKGDLTRSSISIGTCWLGVDFNGKVYSFATGLSTSGMDSLTGEVDASTGHFIMTSPVGATEVIAIAGNIGADGSISSGTWHNSTASGSFSAAKLPIP